MRPEGSAAPRIQTHKALFIRPETFRSVDHETLRFLFRSFRLDEFKTMEKNTSRVTIIFSDGFANEIDPEYENTSDRSGIRFFTYCRGLNFLNILLDSVLKRRHVVADHAVLRLLSVVFITFCSLRRYNNKLQRRDKLYSLFYKLKSYESTALNIRFCTGFPFKDKQRVSFVSFLPPHQRNATIFNWGNLGGKRIIVSSFNYFCHGRLVFELFLLLQNKVLFINELGSFRSDLLCTYNYAAISVFFQYAFLFISFLSTSFYFRWWLRVKEFLTLHTPILCW